MRYLLPLAFLSLAVCSSPESASGDPPPPESVDVPDQPPEPPPNVEIAPADRQMQLSLSESLLRDLRLQRWESATKGLKGIDPTTLGESERAAWAFVYSWALIKSEQPEKAADLVPLFVGTPHIPADYANLVRGEVFRKAGNAADALVVLADISPDSRVAARAQLVRAEVLIDLERGDEAYAIYGEMVTRSDPADGNPEALLALAAHATKGSAEAYGLARRVWAAYPKTHHAVSAAKILGAYEGAEYRPTWGEVGVRAEQLMNRRDYSGVIRETDRVLDKVDGNGEDACRLLYARGRSYYRQNQLSNSIAGFGDAGERCTKADGNYGPRALYLTGMAQYRKSQFTQSAASYQKIAALYPDSSYADDGLTRAGIALHEADDLKGAQASWRKALDEFPSGDTAPEATWRLAWSLYLDGKPNEARGIAERLGALDLHGDHVHVEAGRYWSARWTLYPDVNNPTVAVTDLSAKEQAIADWTALCEELPQSFYSILAYNRLLEVAPDVAAELAKRSPEHERGAVPVPWSLRPEFAAHEGIQAGIALARLGLITEARAEWGHAGFDELTPDEKALFIELRIGAGDWLFAHDDFRQWLKGNPVGTLGDNEPQIVRVAYPDRYWPQVQRAAEGDRYDPRLFHALSREESNFNRHIVSHAGAIGLSQLMPATADQVAGWLGMKVDRDALMDPETNLKIGARYIDSLHKQQHGSPFLSLMAYNAGGGRVSQWLKRFGNVPTDEFVEHVPYRETRGYVKRVMGTWQIYRWQFDDGDAFYDLSAFNHQAKPDLPE